MNLPPSISLIASFTQPDTQGKKPNNQIQLKDSVEIPIREDERGGEGPEVEPEAQPAGAHLHPHSWHAALHGLGGGVGSEGGHTSKKYNLNQVKITHAVIFFLFKCFTRGL